MDDLVGASRGTDPVDDVRTLDDGSTWVVVHGPADLPRAAERHGLGADVCAVLRLKALPRRGVSADRPVRAHVDRTVDGTLVVTAPTLSYDDRTRQVSTGALVLVVGAAVILTAETGTADVVGRTAARLVNGPRVPDEGVQQVLAAALLALVATAGDVEVELGDAVVATESEVFAAVPSGDPVQRWLRRVQTTADRVDDHLDGHDRLLGDMLSAHLSRVSVQQNEDMRKISAWAAIAAVPTLVAGVYGMNFHHMPELSWTYGYPVALLGTGAVCWWLHRLFRRSGWL